jgi:hypothetical protein
MDINFFWSGFVIKEWKIRQQIYHKTSIITDHADGSEIVLSCVGVDSFAATVVEYFTHVQSRVVQPFKAYAVAIIYAKMLEKYFNEDFYAVLDDPDLLFGNDRYFVPYSGAKQVYAAAIQQLQHDRLFDSVELISLPQIQTTIAYFKQEFLLA